MKVVLSRTVVVGIENKHCDVMGKMHHSIQLCTISAMVNSLPSPCHFTEGNFHVAAIPNDTIFK